MLVANQFQRGKHVKSNNVVKPNKTRFIQPLNETCYFYCLFTKGGSRKVFFKTKICRNKLHIYPEVKVHVAKQSPVELIELYCLVPGTPS